MIRDVIKYGLYFVFLVLLQVVVLNNINLFNSVNPYLYIAFIIALPLELASIWLFFLSFLLGLSIDLFVMTPGIHAASAVFAAYIRSILIRLMQVREGYDPGTTPSVSDFGWGWFLQFASIVVFLHHLTLFVLDAFSFNHFGMTILHTFASFAFTMLLLIVTQSKFKKRGLSE
jgi:hypothetical protein